jgi:hypothetical protein
MHEIMDKSFIWVQKFGTLFNKKWITISELLQRRDARGEEERIFERWRRFAPGEVQKTTIGSPHVLS